MKLICIFVLLTINFVQFTKNIYVPKVDESLLNKVDCKPSIVGTPYFNIMEHWKNLSLENIEGEIWKYVLGFENIYQVSNFGRIKSLYRNSSDCNGRNYTIQTRILKQDINNSGYLSIHLRKLGNTKTIMTHRIVALSFIENKFNKKEVNHKDGVKTNNVVINLEWSTPSENQKHSYNILNRKRTFKGKFGKENPFSIPIVQLDINGNKIKEWDSIMDVKRQFGFDPSAIVCVIKNRYRSINGKKYYRKSAYGFKWKYK